MKSDVECVTEFERAVKAIKPQAVLVRNPAGEYVVEKWNEIFDLWQAAWNRTAPGWLPIAEAPKTKLGEAAIVVIMGFAPDEEGYSPNSREGFWNPSTCDWRPFGDPDWASSPQPTHYMLLPLPPTSGELSP